jgi:hypothetical protein
VFIPHLSTIRRQFWHYRLVSRVKKSFGEPMESMSACKYWCVGLPTALFVVTFITAVILFLGGGLFTMIGVGTWKAIHHPMAALVDVGYTAATVVGVVLLVALCVWAEKLLKRHCPPLTIED